MSEQEISKNATPILADVIKRLNHELNQVSRITSAPDVVQQKIYAISIVFNLMIILKDLSGLAKNISKAVDEEEQMINNMRTRGLVYNIVYNGIGNKIKTAHAIIKNLVQLYKIDHKIFVSLDEEHFLGDASVFTSDTLETKIIDDNTDEWYIGRRNEQDPAGFGLTPISDDQSASGGYRKSYKYGRRSRRRHTRKNI
jgi:hypothetical protein